MGCWHRMLPFGHRPGHVGILLAVEAHRNSHAGGGRIPEARRRTENPGVGILAVAVGHSLGCSLDLADGNRPAERSLEGIDCMGPTLWLV